METLENTAFFHPLTSEKAKPLMRQGVREKSDFGEKNALWGENGENSGRKHSKMQITPTYTESQKQGGYQHDKKRKIL